MKFLRKKWLLLSCALLAASPLLATLQSDKLRESSAPSPKNLSPNKPMKWDELLKKNPKDILKLVNNLPEKLRPNQPVGWQHISKKSPNVILKLANNLPEKLFTRKPIKWDDLLRKNPKDILKLVNNLPERLRPSEPIKWDELLNKSTKGILELINNLPEVLRPNKPVEWIHILTLEHNLKDIVKFIYNLPEAQRPVESLKWQHISQNSPKDILKIFKSFPELQLAKTISWHDIKRTCKGDAEEMANFVKNLPEHLKPNTLNLGIFLNLRSFFLKFDDPRWSPSHKKSFSALAPVFFATRDLKKNEFETWLSLTQLDRVELLRMCARGDYFQKIDLLAPDDLDEEGLTTYLQDALFPGGQWIGEDLQRTATYLQNRRQTTPAIVALRRLVEAATPLEGRLPQLRNQTVHAFETESYYEDAFKVLQTKYPNPIHLDATTFEEICMKLVRLTLKEYQDAFSQLKRLQREGEQERLNVTWAAVSSLNDPDAVFSFIKGGFVGPWRMYWDMKSDAEKINEIKKLGGEAKIQEMIYQGRYRACLSGSRTMLVEALSGIHPDVPLSASKEDIYNILLMKINPFIEKMKAEGKNASQFWEFFEQENLAQESPMATHEAFKDIKSQITDELLNDYFEE
ncbi:MAG: hypothetical protein ACRC4G_04440 [Alphaproteobacteria bacterium]